jgi:uncharacterized membrane protein
MFRRYFITGLLIWIPIAITLWVLNFVISTLDLSLSLLPAGWQPERFIGQRLPGIGALLTLLVIFLTGVLTANFLGQRLLKVWEQVLARIPIVNTVYSSVKQVSDTLLSPQGNAFRKALLVEYPRRGCWTIGFLTGTPAQEIQQHIEDDMVSLYVPTTPNPTSGFFLMVPRADTRELDMSVDEALKYVVSMGVVVPTARAPLPLPPQITAGESGPSSFPKA